jgi:hypothetical protein
MMHILQMWSASAIAGSAMLPTFIYCDAFRSCSDYPGNRLGPVGITAKPDFACEYEPVIKYLGSLTVRLCSLDSTFGVCTIK